MTRTRGLLLLALVALVAAFFAFDLARYFSLDWFRAQRSVIDAYYAAQPLQTAAIYFVVYVLVTALSLPGAAIMTLAGGAIFGLVWGTVIVSFASTLGATLAFMVARFLLRDWVQTRFGQRLAGINAGVERDGAFYLFALRLVPVLPFVAVNLLMALTPIRTATYIWVSQLGMLAGTIAFVYAGTELAQFRLSFGLIAAFTLLGLFPLAARRLLDVLKARRVYARWPRPARFDCNVVVIGGGSAGLVTAYIAAAVKAKVTLIEKHRMGGDCLNTGCVPSKALIRSAKFLAEARRAPELGMRAATVDFDFAEVMTRVQRVITTIEPHDSVARYTALGVECIEGEARITSPWTVEVRDEKGATRTLSTRAIVIAAGARPLMPPIPGIDTVGCLTSDTVWSLRELPKRLVVLGGGPIGCELAQCFARFGSQVTLVEMLPRLLVREDPEIAARVEQRFRAEGITVLTGHRAQSFSNSGGVKNLVCQHAGGTINIGFDAVLCALGRAANTTGYGLEELGIPLTKAGTIETNAWLQTNYPNIYACGDVAGPYQFTHTAAHQAWYAAVNALFGGFRKFAVDYSVIPWATFTDPEIARVGLNETEAKEKNIPFEVTRFDLAELDRAIADEAAHGVVKVLTVPGKDRILGVTIAGEHAGDLIAEYVTAMRHGLGLNKILGTIHIYPTLAEANKYAAGAWKRAHAPARLLAWVGRYHAWLRG
jgi:dihydrolipoamide dehydrogenase